MVRRSSPDYSSSNLKRTLEKTRDRRETSTTPQKQQQYQIAIKKDEDRQRRERLGLGFLVDKDSTFVDQAVQRRTRTVFLPLLLDFMQFAL